MSLQRLLRCKQGAVASSDIACCESTWLLRKHDISSSSLSERGALRDVHLDADGLHARLQHLCHLRRPQPPGKDSLPRSNSQAHLNTIIQPIQTYICQLYIQWFPLMCALHQQHLAKVPTDFRFITAGIQTSPLTVTPFTVTLCLQWQFWQVPNDWLVSKLPLLTVTIWFQWHFAIAWSRGCHCKRGRLYRCALPIVTLFVPGQSVTVGKRHYSHAYLL